MFNIINLQLFAETETETKQDTKPEIKQEPETKPETVTKQETETKPETNYSKEFEEIGKSLKNINNNISKLKEENQEVEEDDTIILSSENNNKILVDKNNKKLTDYEVYKRTLNQIRIDKEANKDVPLHPNFINYMEKYVEHVDKGGKPDEFKKEAIFKEIDVSKLKFENKK